VIPVSLLDGAVRLIPSWGGAEVNRMRETTLCAEEGLEGYLVAGALAR
jgi:hypothetical protein